MGFDQIITGGAGFIGSHLCRELSRSGQGTTAASLDLEPAPPGAVQGYVADVRAPATLESVAARSRHPLLVHLAAVAEAVIPFDHLHELGATNVDGTINVLEAFEPALIVFASSSAVYGTLRSRAARPTPEDAAPCGAYGVSKRMGELACSQWASDRRARAVALRLGNVVGPRCRGLVPYLVAHAVKHPDGSVPARLRGEGQIVRDYVGVDHVVAVIERCGDLSLEAGEMATLNVGSGIEMTNGEVARIVSSTLERQGLHLDLNFESPLCQGESAHVVLDVAETTRSLDVPPPAKEAVVGSIVAATLDHLEIMTTGAS